LDRQPGDTGQISLRNVAGNEFLRADMLGGGGVNKIPRARSGIIGMAGAQFITPLEQVRQAV
jgi:hypothetical protein